MSGSDNPMFGRNGEDNPNWRGGITPERQSIYQSEDWKSLVSKVWKRDKATCKRCGVHRNDVDMDIHHIIPFYYVDHRLDLDNLILLCKECHHWVHSNQNKDDDFIEII